jgi:hypothetical protein
MQTGHIPSWASSPALPPSGAFWKLSRMLSAASFFIDSPELVQASEPVVEPMACGADEETGMQR